jgi:hypothetical protein
MTTREVDPLSLIVINLNIPALTSGLHKRDLKFNMYLYCMPDKGVVSHRCKR